MARIVEAREEHVPQIIDVWKGFVDLHAERDPVFTRCRDGHLTFTSWVREQIASPDAQVLVAFEDGDVVGYALTIEKEYPPVYERTTYAEVTDMAVNQGHRRQGIGTALLERVRAWCRERGLDRIELRMMPTNPMAASFWRKHGFRDYIHVMYRELDTKDGLG